MAGWWKITSSFWGDVRDDSYDSRCLGFVPRSALVGRVLVIYAPGGDFWNRLLVLPGLIAPAGGRGNVE